MVVGQSIEIQRGDSRRGAVHAPFRTWVICHGYNTGVNFCSNLNNEDERPSGPLNFATVTLHFHARSPMATCAGDRRGLVACNEEREKSLKSAAPAHVHSSHAASSC